MRKAAWLATALTLLPVPALGQVVERNLPPAPPAQGADIIAPNAVPAEQDATPIGPALSAIVLLGSKDSVLAAAAPGVDASRVARLDGSGLDKRLAAWIGQPLSRRLIAEVEAEIARHYRNQGFPFVALSTPEQEITSGTLQIRVVEFSAGEIAVSPDTRSSPDWLRGRVRQQSGAPIDARRLSQDLDWLGRNPFRGVQALFAPGDGLGRSDLTLAVVEPRPWRVYAGASNSGSATSGRTRLFAGFQVAPFSAEPDAVLSYQFTASDQIFDRSRPSYASNAATLNWSFAPRQAIELTVNHVETDQPVAVFDVRQNTSEAILGWRGAIGTLGDLRLGVEARRSDRTVLFGAIPIIAANIDVVQLYAGFEGTAPDHLGRTSYAVTVHVSPGGIGDRNKDAAFAAYSNGRVTDSSYAYVDVNLTRQTRLGRLSLINELLGRLATGPLPETEQAGIGGPGLVRGYMLDDGAFDDGIIARNTLYLPDIGRADPDMVLQPFLFVDAGYARARVTRQNATAASAGAGGSLRIGRFVNASANLGRAFTSADYTREGDWRAEARISFAY